MSRSQIGSKWVLTALVAFSALFGMELGAQEFRQKADGQFDLDLPQSPESPAAGHFTGSVREGEKTQVRVGETILDLRSYPGAIAAIVTEEGRDFGRLFVFKRENGNFVALNRGAIKGRAASLAVEVEAAVDGLKKFNKWDAGTSLKALAAYFELNPDKQMTAFLDEVELGNMRSIPRAVAAVEEEKEKPKGKVEADTRKPVARQQQPPQQDQGYDDDQEDDSADPSGVQEGDNYMPRPRGGRNGYPPPSAQQQAGQYGGPYDAYGPYGPSAPRPSPYYYRPAPPPMPNGPYPVENPFW